MARFWKHVLRPSARQVISMSPVNKKLNYVLPEGVQDLLPPKATELENLRRTIMDIMTSWGYEYVIPPSIEYLDSLLGGLGPDLDLQTFKLIDQLTGRMLGVPADITPQIARIDEKFSSGDTVERYCYSGPILHTLSDRFAGSRNPLQIGAELYGHDDEESDAEIITLLVEILRVSGVHSISLELADMGLYRVICRHAGFDEAAEDEILKLLLKKDSKHLKKLLQSYSIEKSISDLFISLLELNGPAETIEIAYQKLKHGPREVIAMLDSLKGLVLLLKTKFPKLQIGVDLAELRGFRYHSSTTFSVYTPLAGRSIAWGGRYHIENGSYCRSATGFSADLRTLHKFGNLASESRHAILAPAGNERDLLEEITRLRGLGNKVIQSFSHGGNSRSLRFEKRLVKRNGNWCLEDAE